MRRASSWHRSILCPFHPLRFSRRCTSSHGVFTTAALPVTSSDIFHASSVSCRDGLRSIEENCVPLTAKPAPRQKSFSENGNFQSGVSTSRNAIMAQEPSLVRPSTGEHSAWTLERMHSIIQRHRHLWDQIPLFSSISLSMSASPPLSVEATGREVNIAAQGCLTPLSHDSGSATRSHHAAGTRFSRNSVAACREIRSLLDHLTQEPHRLQVLVEGRRDRLVLEACRLGYAVGLYKRCCAVYVDLMLLGRGRGSNSVEGSIAGDVEERSTFSSSSSAVAPTAFLEGVSSSAALASLHVGGASSRGGSRQCIPDFIIDAAGEAGDLTALQMFLPYIAPVMEWEAKSLVPPTLTGKAVAMGFGWLAVVQLYMQCLRQSLRRGWHENIMPLSSAAEESHRAFASSSDADDTSDAADVHLRSFARASSSLYPQPHQTEKIQWHDFTVAVLRKLCVDDTDAASLFVRSLRTAYYYYVDSDGDWTAAQSAVYALCYRYWLREDDGLVSERGAPRQMMWNRRHTVTVAEGNGKDVTFPRSWAPVQHPKMQVLLTAPALVALLRAAVVARRHDVAEWATLYVDACLMEWVDASKGNTAKNAQGMKRSGWTNCIAAVVTPPAPPPPDLHPSTSMPHLDTLFVWYLRYLQQSGQRLRAVRWLARLRRQQSTTPLLANALRTLPLAREAARLASEVLDAELALWCLQVCLGDATSTSSSATVTPGHEDLFQCLCAYARCDLPNFSVVLQSLHTNELLQLTLEETLFVHLLHARRSVHWRAELERCIAPYTEVKREQGLRRAHGGEDLRLAWRKECGHAAEMPTAYRVVLRELVEEEKKKAASSSCQTAVHKERAKDTSTSLKLPQRPAEHNPPHSGSVFSPRVMHHILIILQEGEHEAFMGFYRAFLRSFSAHISANERARWVLLALTWLTQHHDSALEEDVRYITREVEQLLQLQQPHQSSGEPSPPPLPADLRRALQRKWAMFNGQQQRQSSLFEQHVNSQQPRAEQDRGAFEGGPRLSTDPKSSPAMPPSPRNSNTGVQWNAAVGPAPYFARFTRKRHLLPTAAMETSALDLLQVSVWDAHAANLRRARQLDAITDDEASRDFVRVLETENWVRYLKMARLFR